MRFSAHSKRCNYQGIRLLWSDHRRYLGRQPLFQYARYLNRSPAYLGMLRVESDTSASAIQVMRRRMLQAKA